MRKFGKPSPKPLAPSRFNQEALTGQLLVTDVQGNLKYQANYEKEAIWQVLSQVQDPEIPSVSILDLGIVRHISVHMRQITLAVSPTYSGCPATDLINDLIMEAMEGAGYQNVNIKQALSPAWSSDFITPEGREKLKAVGIAPPKGMVSKASLIDRDIPCPHCESQDTRLLSEFGSTACKALYQCNDCREAFDYFKCI